MAATPASAEASRLLAIHLRHVIRERRLPGAGFVTFDLGGATASAVAGVRRAGGNDPVQIDDGWHIGSVTKAMTATILLRLHDQGVLDLDESVLSGLEGTGWELLIDAQFDRVSIADLLSHRSGMRANPTYALFSRYVLFGEDIDRTNSRAVRQALTEGVGPAGAYEYSNSGYGIAGLIASHRTGRTWEQLIAEHVVETEHLDPLGFGRPEWHAPAPWGHRRRLDGQGFTEFRITKRGLDLDAMRPAGDVFLNLDSLAQHGSFHLRQLAGVDGKTTGQAVLSDASAARLYTPVGGPMDPRRGGSYAMGWNVEDAAPEFGGERLLWHNGSDLFSFTMLGLLPESGVGFAYSTNALQKHWRDDDSLVWEPVAAMVRTARLRH
ncbi:serine hydrolase domain-containing protein [Demequina aurantiaca]|uniref:serine hydrolase domain-containing protein n=1 Tax=Demequina aurantiaca TaxID=676200 RepID=UPI003D336715